MNEERKDDDPIILTFGEWLPDLPDLNNPGVTVAKNVVPEAIGYSQMGGLSTVSDALGGRCLGAAAYRDSASNVYNVSGDSDALYQLSAATQTDASKGGGYSTGDDENWEFTKYGEIVLATNFSDDVQAITLGTSNFADLGGSPPKARHITVVRNQVVLGNLNDSGTVRPNRIQWCGQNAITTWGSSAAAQSDYQDLFSDAAENGGGWIMGVNGGEYGVVFMEYTIYRMTYIGSPAIYQFDEVLPGIGTPARNSRVQVGDTIYFLSQDGFGKIINGSKYEPIGQNKVDQTFFSDLDTGHYENVIGAADVTNRKIFWIYAGSGNSDGIPNKIIIYDWVNNKWSESELNTQWIFRGLGQGYTLDSLDTLSSSIDTLTASLDSRDYTAGNLSLSVYDSSNQLASLDGTPLTAEIETVEGQVFDGKRAYVSGIKPLIDASGATITIQIGVRDLQNTTYSYGASSTPHPETEVAPFRSDARYHRAKVSIAGGFSKAVGVEIEAQPSGER